MKILWYSLLALFMSVNTLAQGSSLEKIKKTKTLKVCSESGYLPLEMKTSTGRWLGFDVAMMEAYAKELGVQLVMLDTKWDGIIPSILSFKCDAIASSMAITPQREKAVLFSDRYYENKFLIATRDTPQNRARFRSISDFNNASVSIAVKTGSSPDLFVQDSHIVGDAKILRFDADADTVSAVLNGKTDAFIYDTPYVKLASLHYPGKLYVLPKGFNGDYFGVAFRKQDSELQENFNQFLKKWKSSGSYHTSLKYYFEGMEWNAELNK